MCKLDWDKPLRTVRDKLPARLICTDAKSVIGATHVVLITFPDGDERAYAYHPSGRGSWRGADTQASPYDLENEPTPRRSFRNIYLNRSGSTYPTREQVDMQADEGRIGVLELIFDDFVIVDQIYHKM